MTHHRPPSRLNLRRLKKPPRRRKYTKIQRTEQMKGTDVLKDGFYDPSLHEGEPGDLETELSDDIRDEIALLRIYIRRLSLLAKGVNDLDEAVVALGALGRACTQVASLLRSQRAFDASKSSDAFAQALAEVMEEFNLR